MNRQLLAAPDYACSVSFLDFALPVMIGSLAGLGAGLAARAIMANERQGTRDAAASVARSGAFWFVGGMLFVLRQRRPHH